ncbi:hypothetical protein BKH43_06255 [Helicobacter sp. 13S00401-1]|uniref:epoxyqueuosine reductase QueH n=1 Tax=Helicobacter sp. 13S00401-1 TaxID=1905758 RepID=UPI000BA543CC|nr:epoxyqueuosine reductase QueH [Helicobacter sp. 13S00401-1]PAF49693.1 hypothetical protein BKH43_06255 [Helicobacter sp. 13S00401-1]
MLVHICCSVDSHFYLQELKKIYPNENLSAFFYNPNIHPKAEHDLRLEDVRRSCLKLNVPLLEDIFYEDTSWLKQANGLESEPEKGTRCSMCFDMRLEKTALKAKELGMSKFTTTLLSSPMKKQTELYMLGDIVARRHDLEFIKVDVRKDGGTQRQSELAKKDRLYSQNYCGCIHALSAQRNKQARVPLELLMPLSKQVLPASIEDRSLTFKKRDSLESKGKGYILRSKKMLVWRLISASVKLVAPNDTKVLNSYILLNSDSKSKAKSGNIIYIKPRFITEFLKVNYPEKLEHYLKDESLSIGYSKRDDFIFLSLKMLNLLSAKNFKSIKDIDLSYEEELKLRGLLGGADSINAIIILDTIIPHSLLVDIYSIRQIESVYEVIEEHG